MCIEGLQRGFPVHLKEPWPLFGISFYLFSLFGEEMRNRGEGADRVQMRGRDEKKRWRRKGVRNMKRMKRR